jgi:hypothetical protein
MFFSLFRHFDEKEAIKQIRIDKIEKWWYNYPTKIRLRTKKENFKEVYFHENE